MEQAREISEFLLSPDSFDDQRQTPGEIEYFQNRPVQALYQDHYFVRFARNSRNRIIAVNIFQGNEQKTGGYIWEYMAVHRNFRKLGIASRLIEDMLNQVRSAQGRYIIGHTCDLDIYHPMHLLFEKAGFQRIGYYPDYYFENEGRYSYMIHIS